MKSKFGIKDMDEKDMDEKDNLNNMENSLRKLELLLSNALEAELELGNLELEIENHYSQMDKLLPFIVELAKKENQEE